MIRETCSWWPQLGFDVMGPKCHYLLYTKNVIAHYLSLHSLLSFGKHPTSPNINSWRCIKFGLSSNKKKWNPFHTQLLLSAIETYIAKTCCHYPLLFSFKTCISILNIMYCYLLQYILLWNINLSIQTIYLQSTE